MWYTLTHLEIFPSERLRPVYYDFVGGKASVSRSTGALTIMNFLAAGEGLYKCYFTNDKPCVMELKAVGGYYS